VEGRSAHRHRPLDVVGHGRVPTCRWPHAMIALGPLLVVSALLTQSPDGFASTPSGNASGLGTRRGGEETLGGRP
jgi:hypothetical protein